MRPLSGCTALVTGATGMLGCAVARRLAAHGMRLVLTGRDPARLAAAAAEIGGAVADTVLCDLHDATQVGALAARATHVDALVHLAAVERVAPFTELTADDIRAHTAIDLTAPLLLVRELLPGMLARRRGHVLLVGSLGALTGGAYQVPYTAAKAGTDAAVRALRAEFAGRGVGFSAVHPAPIRGAGAYARRVARCGPAPRPVGETTPDEVAAAIVAAIRHDREQVIVGRRSARALIALRALAPRTAAQAVRAAGATRYFARVAQEER
ncbi:MAG TPA: SDR family oxidoreductase [Jatrophihabitantaceae bacterium]|jgi:short-subunit dehydrogenase